MPVTPILPRKHYCRLEHNKRRIDLIVCLRCGNGHRRFGIQRRTGFEARNPDSHVFAGTLRPGGKYTQLAGAERYLRVRPYLAALPVGTPLNVCTAPGMVLDALSEGSREFGLNPQDLETRRKDACFPTLEDLRGALGDAAYNELKNSLTESSRYFRATAWVTIGTTQFTLYSLLARSPGSVRPVLRSFGSE